MHATQIALSYAVGLMSFHACCFSINVAPQVNTLLLQYANLCLGSFLGGA